MTRSSMARGSLQGVFLAMDLAEVLPAVRLRRFANMMLSMPLILRVR